jgi:hypothetical protein
MCFMKKLVNLLLRHVAVQASAHARGCVSLRAAAALKSIIVDADCHAFNTSATVCKLVLLRT